MPYGKTETAWEKAMRENIGKNAPGHWIVKMGAFDYHNPWRESFHLEYRFDEGSAGIYFHRADGDMGNSLRCQIHSADITETGAKVLHVLLNDIDAIHAAYKERGPVSLITQTTQEIVRRAVADTIAEGFTQPNEQEEPAADAR